MFYQVLRNVERQFDRLDSTEWFFVLVVVIIIGLVALRGFGSRTNY
ncbi:MAG: hypothetical protein ACOY3P_17995 [Planctomycetota bacterium]